MTDEIKALDDRIATLKGIHPHEKGCMVGELVTILTGLRASLLEIHDLRRKCQAYENTIDAMNEAAIDGLT